MSDARTAVRRVTDALAALESASDNTTFACRRTLPVDALSLSVDGVGELRLPLSSTRARKLASMTTPAPFGRGRETLLDPTVRDVGEIKARKLGLDRRAWNKTLIPALDEIRLELGLPDGRLTARLDKLLVYGPGQFFKPHRDTERADDMIGTLVVVLPSPHKGGTLNVSHQGETRRFVNRKTTAPQLSLYAFYATCEHEVRPVTEGHRVVLSHTLHFRAARRVDDPLPNPGLRRALAAFFDPSDKPTSHYGKQLDKLVYLLDHSYSPRSLGWQRMKGDDQVRAAALHLAAAELGLQAHIALVNVTETWSAMVDEPRYYRSQRGRRSATWEAYEDESDEDDDEDENNANTLVAETNYELDELIDRSASLEHWRDTADRSVELPALGTHEDELCWTVDLEMHPSVFEEYEGYMGNYGNTLQREYRRAAVVLWSVTDRYRILAQSPKGGRTVIRELVRDAGTLPTRVLREAVASLLEVWPGREREMEPDVLAEALSLARLLALPALAIDLLRSISIAALTQRNMPALLELSAAYGDAFSRQLFECWLGMGEPADDRRTRFDRQKDIPQGRWFGTESDTHRLHWLAELPAFCRAAASSGESAWTGVPELAFDALLELLQSTHAGQHELVSLRARSRHSDQERRQVLALLEVGTILGDNKRIKRLLTAVTDELDGYASAVPVDVLERLNSSPRNSGLQASCKTLHRRVAALVELRISNAERRDGDWRIEATPSCTCADCRTLATFLQSRDDAVDLPRAKDRRRHLHNEIRSLEIPLTHTTRREGSPFVLELRKQVSMFKDAEKRVRSERMQAVRLVVLVAAS